jgi:hypothetical protein
MGAIADQIYADKAFIDETGKHRPWHDLINDLVANIGPEDSDVVAIAYLNSIMPGLIATAEAAEALQGTENQLDTFDYIKATRPPSYAQFYLDQAP